MTNKDDLIERLQGMKLSRVVDIEARDEAIAALSAPLPEDVERQMKYLRHRTAALKNKAGGDIVVKLFPEEVNSIADML